MLSLLDRFAELLVTLVRNKGQVLSARRLLELVWGYSDSDTRTVTVHIRSLRSKIEQISESVPRMMV